MPGSASTLLNDLAQSRSLLPGASHIVTPAVSKFWLSETLLDVSLYHLVTGSGRNAKTAKMDF